MTNGFGGGLAAALMMVTAPALAQGTRVTLRFTPESDTPAFEVAAAEYRSIWAAKRYVEGRPVRVMVTDGADLAGVEQLVAVEREA